ncbi:MAG: type II secretion system F family protein, partial [Acidobacteria bacterium]
MSELTLALIALFTSLALLTGAVTSSLLARRVPGRRRLLGMAQSQAAVNILSGPPRLVDTPSASFEKWVKYVPKSPGEMNRLQRRLANAGYHGFTPVLVYGFAELILTALGFGIVFLASGKILFAIAGAILGYMIPSLIVARRINRRKLEIQNGLPDALDLLIVSLEAGLALDQALLKSAEELEIAYPALSHELGLINIETRAGKPRLEALKNFAKRTQVDDVRALVAMLVQTDRFGTSVAQALRTHAEVARTKRRQRAEEKAAKLGVKL